MPDLQYQHEKPDPNDLDVEGVEMTFGLTGGQWKHWYDGEHQSALADWEHREICNECDSGEGDREPLHSIESQVYVFFAP